MRDENKNIIQFPVVPRPQGKGEVHGVEDVIANAILMNLETAVLIGMDKDGKFRFDTTTLDMQTIHWLTMELKMAMREMGT